MHLDECAILDRIGQPEAVWDREAVPAERGRGVVNAVPVGRQRIAVFRHEELQLAAARELEQCPSDGVTIRGEYSTDIRRQDRWKMS